MVFQGFFSILKHNGLSGFFSILKNGFSRFPLLNNIKVFQFLFSIFKLRLTTQQKLWCFCWQLWPQQLPTYNDTTTHAGIMPTSLVDVYIPGARFQTRIGRGSTKGGKQLVPTHETEFSIKDNTNHEDA